MTDYEIRDPSGALIATHSRIDDPDGKRFIWRLPDGTLGLDGRHVADLPLYGIDRDLGRSVVVTEGEKAADALHGAGIGAVGTVTGASSAPSVAALSDLAGKIVYLWPDADDVGRGHMERIAERLTPIAASVRWIEPGDRPKGWDAADAVAELTIEAVKEMIAGAVDARADILSSGLDAPSERMFPEPEDFGLAEPSALVSVEYVEDFLRPGRLVVVAAEEGTGKSFALTELGVRLAKAGGSFAETWPVVVRGPVLALSEMHSDDDILRLETVCASLGLDRRDIAGSYFRLPLYTAANGKPCLMDATWRAYITDWCKVHKTLLAVFDTATGAVDADPWGREIQAVFRSLRAMLAEYPELVIVLVVHLKKPQARGERRLSDVLGEWGRWSDVVVLMEADGFERTKITTRKRVVAERRIVVTKRAGLLVEPQEVSTGGAKVSQERFLAVLAEYPDGVAAEDLAAKLGVSARTIGNYAKSAGAAVVVVETRLKGSAKRVRYHSASRGNAETRGNEHVSTSLSTSSGGLRGNGKTPYIEGVSLSASPHTALKASFDMVSEPAVPTDLSAMVPRFEP